MTLSRKSQFSLQAAVSVSAILIIIIFSLTYVLPSQSGSGEEKTMDSLSNIDQNIVEGSKTVLGSRPPGCVNKCRSCHPCKATLVIPPHQDKGRLRRKPAHREDDTYYLLSWKCRCGNKLFQP